MQHEEKRHVTTIYLVRKHFEVLAMDEQFLEDLLNEYQNIVLGCFCLMGTASQVGGSKIILSLLFFFYFANI